MKHEENISKLGMQDQIRCCPDTSLCRFWVGAGQWKKKNTSAEEKTMKGMEEKLTPELFHQNTYIGQDLDPEPWQVPTLLWRMFSVFSMSELLGKLLVAMW